ncbi:MAG: leucine-rich repeat domain-containing protein [Clostridia bacterium]|nr:leucine-rich repeat domain-containing protein [Clostridia bacterium]
MEKAQQARNENDKGAMKDSASLLATNYIQEYMEKRYVQMLDGFATTYANAGAYAKSQFPSATEGGFTYRVSGDELTVTDTKGNSVTGTILDNGNISWNSENDNGDTGDTGNTSGTNWDSIKASATKHGDQSEENTDIGIGQNGEAINLDLWEYKVIDGTQTIQLGDYDGGDYYYACYKPCDNRLGLNARNYETANIALPRCIKIGTVWYDVVKLDDGSFSGEKANLLSGSIVIPDTVTTISQYTFEGCSNITNITIPNYVTEIGLNAFGNTGLTEIELPSSIETLPTESYYDYSSLFNGCENLERVVVNCDISDYLFTDLDSLNEIVFGANCNSIGDYAFKGCEGLTSITIPSSVTYLGSDAFADCSELKNVTIQGSITNDDSTVFENCELESVSINGNIPSYLFMYSSISELTIGSNCNSIGEGAFYNCTLPANVTIPNSVTSLEDRAFYDCSGIQTLTISNNITTLYSISGMEENGIVNLPAGITHIYSYALSAFYNCTVNFAGTRTQWNSLIVIDDNGDAVSRSELYTDDVTIHCSDDT